MKRTILHDLYEKQKQSPCYNNLCRPVTDLLPWIARGIRGVTCNPAIFYKAISSSNAYNEQFRYEVAIEAYLDGLEASSMADLSVVQSAAAFYISRVDTVIDKKLAEIGTVEALGLRGKISTIPVEPALKAFMVHSIVSRTLDEEVSEAQRIYKAIEKLGGIDWNGVGSQLETEVLDSFTKCFDSALESLQKKATSSEFITV